MVDGGPAVQVGVILLSVLGLWVGARLLVDAAVRLARRFGLSELVIGLTVVAAGTSAPELAVSVDAAFYGLGDIAVANVLGSNVYNLAFVLGVLSLVRTIPLAGSLGHRDAVALLASTAAVGLALLDLRITRAEGALLAGAFVAYTAFLLRASRTGATGETAGATTEADHSNTGGAGLPTDTGASPTATPGGGTRPRLQGALSRRVTALADFRGRDVAVLLCGLALVLVSGDAMVRSASALARGAGVSESVVGGTVVAAGTSTPEFAVSLVALRRRSLGVSVGNVVGSNILNVTGIVGVAAVVRPLAVSPATVETLAWLAAVSVFVVGALWTGRLLSRLEGALLTATEVARWVLGVLGVVG